jgi:hypothetical protein
VGKTQGGAIVTFTYDLNTNGCLIIKADTADMAALEGLRNESGEFDSRAEAIALEDLLANSELDWIQPEECGDLTDAPILGFRDKDGKAADARWGFMDYQIRSFISDLIETGQAVFTS